MLMSQIHSYKLKEGGVGFGNIARPFVARPWCLEIQVSSQPELNTVDFNTL